MLRLGLDIGSTTAKLVAIDEDGKVCFARYGRHNAQMDEVMLSFLAELLEEVGDVEGSLRVTGSVGMGFSERYNIPFVQEVVAATKAVQRGYITTPAYDEKYRHRKIIIPFFTSFISPLLPALMRVAGYDVESLPTSNDVSAEWGLKYANN